MDEFFDLHILREQAESSVNTRRLHDNRDMHAR